MDRISASLRSRSATARTTSSPQSFLGGLSPRTSSSGYYTTSFSLLTAATRYAVSSTLVCIIATRAVQTFRLTLSEPVVKLWNVMSHFNYEPTPSDPKLSDANPNTHDVIMSNGSTVIITLEDGFSDLSDELTEERPLPADRFWNW